jgi:N6-L-threonylcarbamoyladenine synthase
MKILAIETSCDETSIAIIDDGLKVELIDTISQVPIHQEFGGVVPEVASRNHTLALPWLLEKHKIHSKMAEIDAVAVTTGPGLAGSLLVGVNTARTLGYLFDKPIYPINHLEGHIFSNFINRDPIKFPALVLIVSGGHTQLMLMSGPDQYRMLGETLDDAVGEAFDKVARLLDLPYPGGPEVEKLARQGDPHAHILPIPLRYSKKLDFSFSGLKTAVLYLKLKNPEIKTSDLCASFQRSAIAHLLDKTVLAAKEHKVKSLLICGGVVNNKALKTNFEDTFSRRFPNIQVYCPEPWLCTDNAAMIGAAGYFHSLNSGGKSWYDVDMELHPSL